MFTFCIHVHIRSAPPIPTHLALNNLQSMHWSTSPANPITQNHPIVGKLYIAPSEHFHHLFQSSLRLFCRVVSYIRWKFAL